ncbi:MAG TPA: TfoX/Sxy family protein [Vicinamibacterales bacterium]|nr:TfoX/Sxy family protein [Vicinamibacterales bacterium]
MRTPRSLAVTDGFASFVLDQLHELGDVVPRPMFGGIGLYSDGVFFAILARDRLYLKAPSGAAPFKPFAGRPASRTYFEVPLAVLESPPDLADAARRAIAFARVSGRRSG